jgi:hypothetical protein
MFARYHQGTASSPPLNQMKAIMKLTMAIERRRESSINQILPFSQGRLLPKTVSIISEF